MRAPHTSSSAAGAFSVERLCSAPRRARSDRADDCGALNNTSLSQFILLHVLAVSSFELRRWII